MIRKFFYLIIAVVLFFNSALAQAEDHRRHGDYRNYRNHHEHERDNRHHGHGGDELFVPAVGLGTAIVLSHTCCENDSIPQYYLPPDYRPPSMYVPPLPRQYGSGDMEWFEFRIWPAPGCVQFVSREDMLYECYVGWQDSHPHDFDQAYEAGRNSP